MAKKRSSSDADAQSLGDSEPQIAFEEAVEQLETIVRRLEQGGGPLDEALEDYATAIQLLKHCQRRLQLAERRVEVLSGVDAQGNPVTRPVADAEVSLQEKQQSRSDRRTAIAGPSSASLTDLPSETELF